MPPSYDAEGVICIVDDETAVLASIKRLLESDDLSAVTFDDPVRFVGFACEHPVAVAILDIWMPGMNGVEVQRLLTLRSAGTRVIVMSGRDDPAMREAVLGAGAVAFLMKPFDDSAFLSAVHRALGSTA